MPAAASDGPSTPVQGYSTNYKIYILILLTLIYISNYADRVLVGVVSEAIKAEFGVADWQIGLLSGATFAIFYATLGVPIALYADRSNRVRIIAASAVIWSVFTALSGAATNFTTMALARIGVGVGEAGSGPPSHSIISDLFSPKARTTALAVYSLGVPLGLVLAYQAGARIASEYSWHMAFIALGVPGVILALIAILTIREPQRGLSEGLKDTGKAPPLMTVLRHMLSYSSTRHMVIGATLTTIVGYAGVQWWPGFLIRSHGLTIADLAILPSLVFGLATGLGIIASGLGTDMLSRLDPKWTPRGVAVIGLVALPFLVALYLVDDVNLVYALIFIPAFTGGFYLAPSFAMTQALVGVRMRTVASALLLFIINIIGYTLGPLIPGILADMWKPDYGVHSLRYALLAMSVFSAWGIFHYWMAGNTYKDDLARQKAFNEAESAKA
jgi:predicted MFS family arabinose efflux permease